MSASTLPARAAQRKLAARARRLWDRQLYAYVLLAPTVLVVALLILWPIGDAISLSFHDVGMVRVGSSYGSFTLKNYVKLFNAPGLGLSLWVSLVYVTVVTAFCYAIGLGTAALLNQRFHGRTAARLLIALPWAIPLVVVTNIFWWMLDKTFGIVNYGLVSAHLLTEPIDWFLHPVWAMAGVCATTIWKGYPFFTIMLLAAMQAIPAELYDAAKVDGATAWRGFLHITLPALRPVTGIALLINALWVFREFTVIFVLTGGGPVHATETISVWTYNEAFGSFHMGYASAIGVLTLVISVVASVIFVRMSSRQFYQ